MGHRHREDRTDEHRRQAADGERREEEHREALHPSPEARRARRSGDVGETCDHHAERRTVAFGHDQAGDQRPVLGRQRRVSERRHEPTPTVGGLEHRDERGSRGCRPTGRDHGDTVGDRSAGTDDDTEEIGDLRDGVAERPCGSALRPTPSEAGRHDQADPDDGDWAAAWATYLTETLATS